MNKDVYDEFVDVIKKMEDLKLIRGEMMRTKKPLKHFIRNIATLYI